MEHNLKSFSTRIVLRAILGLALLVCAACGGVDGRKFYPVHGSVLVNGKPAQGVTIIFSLQDDPGPEPTCPTAGTRADGSFELNTWLPKERVLKTGAPAGTYIVTCFWLPPELANVGAGQTAPDKLHGKYIDSKKSKLRAEVPEHAVDLPAFELEVGNK
jgi:hypothetical protein